MYYNAGILFPQTNDYIRIVAIYTDHGLNYRLVPIKAFKILDNDLGAFMAKNTVKLESKYYSGVEDAEVLEEISYNLTIAFNSFVKRQLQNGKAFLMDFKSNEEVQQVFGHQSNVHRGKNQEWTLFNPLAVLQAFNSTVKH